MVSRVRRAAEGKFTIVTVQGHLRPDLRNKAMIIDVTVPFENRLYAVKEFRQRKIEQYQDLASALCGRFQEAKTDAFVPGSSGSWDPENDKVMKTVLA